MKGGKFGPKTEAVSDYVPSMKAAVNSEHVTLDRSTSSYSSQSHNVTREPIPVPSTEPTHPSYMIP